MKGCLSGLEPEMCSFSLSQMQLGNNFSMVCSQRSFGFSECLAVANPMVSVDWFLFTVRFLGLQDACYIADTAYTEITKMDSISFLKKKRENTHKIPTDDIVDDSYISIPRPAAYPQNKYYSQLVEVLHLPLLASKIRVCSE